MKADKVKGIAQFTACGVCCMVAVGEFIIVNYNTSRTLAGNKIISEFQEIIHPILVYVKEKFKDYLKPINIEMSKSGRIATHADLLDFIKKGDEKGYRDAIERHFEVYKIFKVNRSQELMAEKAESEKVEGI